MRLHKYFIRATFTPIVRALKLLSAQWLASLCHTRYCLFCRCYDWIIMDWISQIFCIIWTSTAFVCNKNQGNWPCSSSELGIRRFRPLQFQLYRFLPVRKFTKLIMTERTFYIIYVIYLHVLLQRELGIFPPSIKI